MFKHKKNEEVSGFQEGKEKKGGINLTQPNLSRRPIPSPQPHATVDIDERFKRAGMSHKMYMITEEMFVSLSNTIESQARAIEQLSGGSKNDH